MVLPLVVLTELEGKRHHPELGWAARQALRGARGAADRARHRSSEPLPVNDERRHAAGRAQPPGAGRPARRRSARRPTTTASSPSPATWPTRARDVAVVTKDLPLRLKASIVGLDADEYRNELATDTSWTGFVELDVEPGLIDELYEDRVVDLAAARDLPCHTGLALHAGSQSALARVHADKRLHLVRTDAAVFDVRGRSAEQRVAIDLLTDPEIGIVSLGGNAGTGKSVLALAAGLEAVLERRTHKRVVVFRPLYAVGGQDLGLPARAPRAEKMAPVGGRGHRRPRVDHRATR